jgi:O-antigen/teichoic acid export membrane protein
MERKSADIGQVTRHGLIYFSSGAALVLLQLVSLPVLTRLLSPAEYGIYQIFTSCVAMGAVLFTVNAASSVTRRFLEKDPDTSAFLGSVLVFSVVMLLLFAGVSAVFSARIAGWLGLNRELVCLLAPAMLLTVLHSAYHAVCVATGASRTASLLAIVRGYGGFLIALPLVVMMSSQRYYGLVWGSLGAGAAVAAWLLLNFPGRIAWSPRIEHVRYALTISVPLLFFAFGNLLLGQLDRIMVNSMIGPAEAGIYSLAYNLCMTVDMVTSALHSALVPYWFSHLNEGERTSADRLAEFNYRITLCFGLGLIYFSREALALLAGDSYQEALPLIPLIVGGYVFNAIYKMYLREVSYSKRMWHVALVALLGATVNWLLNLWALPRYGYIAAAYTTLASYLLMAGMAWVVMQYIVRIEALPLSVIAPPTLLFFAGVLVHSLVDGIVDSELAMFAFKSGLLCALCAALLFREIARYLRRGTMQ